MNWQAFAQSLRESAREMTDLRDDLFVKNVNLTVAGVLIHIARAVEDGIGDRPEDRQLENHPALRR